MKTLLMREMVGVTLRDLRVRSSLTLREVSARARVSLGYLSEVERGQKEASSEMLNAICGALDVRLADVLSLVVERLVAYESVTVLPVVRASAAA